MQYFQDTITLEVYAFEDDVIVNDSNGVYSFVTSFGAPLTVIPTTLQPCDPPTPPSVPEPTIAQLAKTALNGTVTLTSAIVPTGNTTYFVDSETTNHIMAEMISIMNSGGQVFADGSDIVVWPDSTGNNHTFTVPQFKNVALAIGSYVASLYKCTNGTSNTLPSSIVTI